MKKRGRKPNITETLTRSVCKLLVQGVDQKSACNLTGVPYSTFNEWKQKGSEGIEPFASFFSVISRARDQHKARLQKIILDAAEGMLPRHADWKAAAWSLEKGWPLEFGDRRPLPIPVEEQTPMAFPMYATLPSGNIAPVSEMMEVARQWHEAAYPSERRDHEPEHDHEHEPMKHCFNRDTGQIERIDN